MSENKTPLEDNQVVGRTSAPDKISSFQDDINNQDYTIPEDQTFSEHDRDMDSLRAEKSGGKAIGFLILFFGVGLAGWFSYNAYMKDKNSEATNLEQSNKEFQKVSVQMIELPEESFKNPQHDLPPISTDVQAIAVDQGLSREELLRLEAKLRQEEAERLKRVADKEKAENKIANMWKRKYTAGLTASGGGVGGNSGSNGNIGGSQTFNPIDPLTGEFSEDRYETFLKNKLNGAIAELDGQKNNTSGGILGRSKNNKSFSSNTSQTGFKGGRTYTRPNSSNTYASNNYSNPIRNNTTRGNVQETPSIEAQIVNDAQYKILQGKVIGAVLESAIQSDHTGMVRAQITEPVYSYEGSRILIPVGSRIIGEYKGIDDEGQVRIAIKWNRIITPENISINIDSPSIDELGRMGASGKVNNHYLKRFGASFLLSMISAYGVPSADGGLETPTQKGSEAFKDIASIALQDQIGIKPTFHKNQGERIRIFVAHDFSLKNLFEAGYVK